MNRMREAQPRKRFFPTVWLFFAAVLFDVALVTLIVSLSSTAAPSPELAAQGNEYYKASCAQCHGYDASGYNGPTLRNLAISNARIAATIKLGVKDHMPAFGKKYDDHQIGALVCYLRTLR